MTARKPLLEKAAVLVREVAVIVAGVSIALAADAFYEKSKDRSERTRILTSIDADLRVDSIAYSRAVGGSLDRALEAATTLLVSMEDPARDLDGIELARVIRQSMLFPSGLKESTTYREMTATGGVGLLGDTRLREEILQYYSRPFTGMPSEMWNAYLSDVNGAYERSLRGHMGSAYIDLMACTPGTPEYDDCLADVSGRIDPSKLRADSVFIERLVGMTLWAGRFRVFVGGQAGAQLRLASQVRSALGGV